MALEALLAQLAQLASAQSLGHLASSAVMRTLRSVVDEIVRFLHLHATFDHRLMLMSRLTQLSRFCLVYSAQTRRLPRQVNFSLGFVLRCRPTCAFPC